jgi:hypothetical protein
MGNKRGSPAAEQMYYISSATPSDADAVVGALYVDPDDGKVYRCTSVGPVVFTEITAGAGGAPTGVDYLVGTASGDLSAEIVVGASPGGELGGTWASPTVDATHSGSAHSSYLPLAGGTLTGAHDAGGADSFEIPNGAGGTTVNATGEVCVDSTSRTLNFYDGTAEVVLNPVQSKAFIIETVIATDDLPIIRMDRAGSLVEVHYLCLGGTNWIGQLQECDANGINGADVQAANTTATSAGGDVEVTDFSNAAYDAGDWIGIKTTSISGTPTSLHVTFYYRENA